MKAEYKRDINGNYLVLYEKEEPDTSSYQMRMLVGNTIPSVLKCRVQGIDGQFMVCFDITSKQSLLSLYEDKKVSYEDLQMIFGGFVQVMEELSEYLLNPCRLVLKPEYMYVDVEKRQLYFCYLPGYDQDIRQKFQELTEYILPILDHEDTKAVMLGYGIYRRALDDSFHLEYIKKELYQERTEEGKQEELFPMQETVLYSEKDKCIEKNQDKGNPEKMWETQAQLPEEKDDELIWQDKDTPKEKRKSVGISKGLLLWCAAAALIALLIVTAETLGYLPRISTAAVLGAAVAVMGLGMLCSWLASLLQKNKKKDNYEEEKTFCEKEAAEEKNVLKEPVPIAKRETEIRTENSSEKEKMSILQNNFGETVVLSANIVTGPATLVSREPGELATIYLQEELTVIGKMETAADAVVNLPTVSRIHAKIRKRDGEYYLTDLNSRNGTAVNGKMLKGDEEYCLQNEDEVDFAQARYVFLK